MSRRNVRKHRRLGWLLNKPIFIATSNGARPVDLRQMEDRLAVREYLSHASTHARRPRHG